MKAKFVAALLLTVLIPFSVSADIRTDMNNPNLSLVVVMQNAMADGMSVADAVSAMIKIEPSHSSSIVTTAMVLAPEEFSAIISSAIAAGADASNVVTAALVAARGKNSEQIVAAADKAAPGQKKAIAAAAKLVLAKAEPVKEIFKPTEGKTVAATVPKTSGGGAVATADQVVVLIETIASLSGDAPTI